MTPLAPWFMARSASSGPSDAASLHEPPQPLLYDSACVTLLGISDACFTEDGHLPQAPDAAEAVEADDSSISKAFPREPTNCWSELHCQPR